MQRQKKCKENEGEIYTFIGFKSCRYLIVVHILRRPVALALELVGGADHGLATLVFMGRKESMKGS